MLLRSCLLVSASICRPGSPRGDPFSHTNFTTLQQLCNNISHLLWSEFVQTINQAETIRRVNLMCPHHVTKYSSSKFFHWSTAVPAEVPRSSCMESKSRSKRLNNWPTCGYDFEITCCVDTQMSKSKLGKGTSHSGPNHCLVHMWHRIQIASGLFTVTGWIIDVTRHQRIKDALPLSWPRNTTGQRPVEQPNQPARDTPNAAGICVPSRSPPAIRSPRLFYSYFGTVTHFSQCFGTPNHKTDMSILTE